jgi:hypothetical protein
MLTETQIRARIKSLTERSWNRLYKLSLIDKEVDENTLLFMARCRQCNKEPETMIKLIIKKMAEMRNLAFCQAVSFVFKTGSLSSWQLPIKRKLNRRK